MPTMRALREVSREQYLEFRLNYPRKLERDVYSVAEPPVVTDNDFTLGDWPESVVAKIVCRSPAEPDAYFIS